MMDHPSEHIHGFPWVFPYLWWIFHDFPMVISFWTYPFSNLQEIFGQGKSPEENYPHLPAANDAPPVVPGDRWMEESNMAGKPALLINQSI